MVDIDVVLVGVTVGMGVISEGSPITVPVVERATLLTVFVTTVLTAMVELGLELSVRYSMRLYSVEIGGMRV